MTEWQRIETAPKDGSEVLVYRADAGVMVAQYGAMDIFGLSDREAEQIEEDHFWFESWWSNSFYGAHRMEGDEAPTHWMPLPDPPPQRSAKRRP